VTLAGNPSDVVTFDPVGPTVALLFGQQLEVTVIPDVGFTLDEVVGCGGSLNGDLYTTGAVTADCTVTASLSSVPVFTVTAAAEGPGTISPSSLQVAQGGSATFEVAVDPAGSLSSVTGCDGTLGETLSYTTGLITGNCTIFAQFDSIYTITVTTGSNGSASPTATEALAGEQPQISITPDTGFEIDTVTGTCGGVLSGAIYTVAAVSADCSVNITFIELDAPLPDAVWGEFTWDEAKWQ
jgi:hypothetical protein